MDRHEYEINQLINPKKDIVKSNSKHRDKIETLILGRNGISEGVTSNSIDGHEYIDLGLPSGTLWATMNVGATSEIDYGNYYMYGMGSKTYDSSDTSYTGKENPLDLTKDTARVVWGGRWHMPTTTLLYELIENTNYEWVTNYKNSGINGGTFTANGKTIFIPAAGNYYKGELSEVGSEGCCWSSKPSEYSNWALLLNLSEEMNAVTETTGIRGFSIRPVVG